MKYVAVCVLIWSLFACIDLGLKPVKENNSVDGFSVDPSFDKLQSLLQSAENGATVSGRQVLETARLMSLQEKVILPGGCWDYANHVYVRAGYANNLSRRHTIFKGSARKPPYADSGLIQAGDFLYFVNHSYHEVEHSAIFVRWVDESKKKALMLSYAGENKRVPARYKAYDISHVFRIIRPRDVL